MSTDDSQGDKGHVVTLEGVAPGGAWSAESEGKRLRELKRRQDLAAPSPDGYSQKVRVLLGWL